MRPKNDLQLVSTMLSIVHFTYFIIDPGLLSRPFFAPCYRGGFASAS